MALWVATPYTIGMEKEKFLKQLGDAIRQQRQSLNVSQEDFANDHKLNRGYYGRIERGEVNITIGTLIEICNKLEIGLSTLIQDIK